MTTATAKSTDARISFKHSLIVCDAIRRKRVSKAKQLLEDLISQKRSLDGKYYTNASKKILEILKTAEANAKQQNLDVDKLFVKSVAANKGYKLILPKSRFKFRGRQAKITHLTIELEER